MQLSHLAAYFDTDAQLLQPSKDWHLIDIEEWDALLQPSRHIVDGKHRFVLAPVDASAQYVRTAPGKLPSPDHPIQDVVVTLPDVSLGLNLPQYQSAHRLLQSVETFQAAAPYRPIRPKCRPRARE